MMKLLTGYSAKRAMTGALAFVLMVGACGPQKEERILFDGIYFRTKAAPVDKKTSLLDFEVTVKKATQAVDGAREAARYEATRYCVQNFGSSSITWVNGGPDAEQIRLKDSDLVVRGRCDKTW